LAHSPALLLQRALTAARLKRRSIQPRFYQADKGIECHGAATAKGPQRLYLERAANSRKKAAAVVDPAMQHLSGWI
jgi:hypothetical protein